MSKQRATSRTPARRSSGDRKVGMHWLLLAALVLAAAFIEVWESTTASALSLEIDRLKEEVADGRAELAHLRTRATEATNRGGIADEALALGMRPADPDQIVVIPTDYLESGSQRQVPSDGFAAVTKRVADVFIPSARARDRGVEEDGT